MSLVNFKDIDCKASINKENIVIDFNGASISVVPYLSAREKYDLIMICLQKSYENGVYNPIKKGIYFQLGVIYMYTSIIFSDEDREDEIELFNQIYNSGLFNAVWEVIPEDEKTLLCELLEATAEDLFEYNRSIAGFLSSIVDVLSEKLQKGAELLKDIDMEKIKEVMENPQLAAILGGKGNSNLN